METAGSPKFLGNPRDHSPCSPTPVGPGRLSRPWVSCLARPPRLTRTRAHHEEISGLNRTAFDLAVYASQGWSPTHHARLASGYWSGSTGRDWLPAGFHLKGFKLPTILLSRAFLARGQSQQPLHSGPLRQQTRDAEDHLGLGLPLNRALARQAEDLLRARPVRSKVPGQ